MRFEAVYLPPGRELGGKVSQTFLRHFNLCPRSGYLYALNKGEASTVEMVRGRAGHRILELATLQCIERGEAMIPGEVVKAIADEVLAEEAVPIEEHDYLRESAYRWARCTTVDPKTPGSVETLFELDVAGFRVRAKIDRWWLSERGGVAHVDDYKTGRGAPTQDDVARKRPDGSLSAKNFQLVLYALVLAFGVPIREEWHLGERTEVREPFPVAERAQRFELAFVFPGIEDRDGEMLRREASLTRLELLEYRGSLEALVRRVGVSEAEGDWPAVVSDQGCVECPAKLLCPIPAELRDHAGRINTVSEAAEALEVLDRRKARDDAVLKEIKAFAKSVAGQRIRFGHKVLEQEFRESERIGNKDGMFAAMERSVLYGEPFERADFVKAVKSTQWVRRQVTEAELAEESLAEGSDVEEAA